MHCKQIIVLLQPVCVCVCVYLLVKGNNDRNAKLTEVKNEGHHGKQIFTIIWFAFQCAKFLIV